MTYRAFFAGFLLLSTGGLLRADGLVLSSISGFVSPRCNAGGTWVTDYHGLTTSASGACDAFRSWPAMPIIDYAGGDITVTGTAIVTMGTNPMVDVQGAVIDNNAFSAGGFVGEANIVYSLGIDQVTSPPHAVPFIPVVITANGSVSGNESYIHGSVSGPDIPYYELLPPNVLRIDLSPNTAYFVGLDARCTAESPGRGVSSSCQAVADPAFQFDQAAFDTLMGTNTFQLADYYSFAYSPELTPPPPPPPTSTPEPSGLVLLGAGLFAVLIGVPGRIRK